MTLMLQGKYNIPRQSHKMFFLESTVYLIPPASENLIGLVISSFSKSPLWQRENEDLQQQTEFFPHKPVLMKPSGGRLGYSVFS